MKKLSRNKKSNHLERPTWPMKDRVKKNWGDINFEFMILMI